MIFNDVVFQLAVSSQQNDLENRANLLFNRSINCQLISVAITAGITSLGSKGRLMFVNQSTKMVLTNFTLNLTVSSTSNKNFDVQNSLTVFGQNQAAIIGGLFDINLKEEAFVSRYSLIYQLNNSQMLNLSISSIICMSSQFSDTIHLVNQSSNNQYYDIRASYSFYRKQLDDNNKLSRSFVINSDNMSNVSRFNAQLLGF